MFLLGSQLSQVGSGPGLAATGKPLAKTVDELITTPPQLPASSFRTAQAPALAPASRQLLKTGKTKSRSSPQKSWGILTLYNYFQHVPLV